MAQHDGKMRGNAQPSKAERQAAMNPANQGNGGAQSKEVTVTATKDKATQAKVEKRVDPNRGQATRTRWFGTKSFNPDAPKMMGADIKALPRDTLITALVPGNPKKRSATARYELYGFNGVQGASITIDALLKRLGERHSHALAFADIAWDASRLFIKLEVPNAAPVPVEPEPTVEGGEQQVAA